MQGTRNTILPLTVRPRWLPDLSYPRFKKWYSTKTYFSEDSTTLVPYTIPSGQHIENMTVTYRNYADAGIPARGTADSIDITSPAYMLAGTDTVDATGDTLVGLDYYNMPLAMDQDIEALAKIYSTGTEKAYLMGRVDAINHKFTFINYNRHPVKIYYTMLPAGWSFDAIESTTAPMADQQNSAYRSIVVPGVEDAGDKGVTRELKFSLNLSKIFPEQYDSPPQKHAGDGSAEISDSPWFAFNSGGRKLETIPPAAQSTGADDSTSAKPIQPPGLWLRICMQNLTGVQTGYQQYTSTTGVGTGQVDTNGVVVMGDFNWLVEYYWNDLTPVPHQGTKAYPDQTV